MDTSVSLQEPVPVPGKMPQTSGFAADELRARVFVPRPKCSCDVGIDFRLLRLLTNYYIVLILKRSMARCSRSSQLRPPLDGVQMAATKNLHHAFTADDCWVGAKSILKI
jgi:hypothetical protein